MDSGMYGCVVSSGVHSGESPQRATHTVATWSWKIGDSDDAAARRALDDFLDDHGVSPQPDPQPLFGRSTPHNDSGMAAVTPHRTARIFVSAAGGATLAGAPTGPPSPAVGIPDVHIEIREPHEVTATIAMPETSGPPARAWRSSWSDAQHRSAIETAQSAIAAGDFYQVNVVRHWQTPFEGDTFGLLATIARLPHARYPAVMRFPGAVIATATPELLLELRNGQLTTRPIKGTAVATAAGRAQLLASTKERAEHIMIVDLMRNDLTRVGTAVRVDELYAVREWAGLWHAESTVSAQTATWSVSELLAAICPGGSVTGAPKQAALRFIADTEPVGRGPAMGAMGTVCSHGLCLGLTIRTIAASDGQLHSWAGGGITIDSDPYAEVDEAKAKAAPLWLALAAYPHST